MTVLTPPKRPLLSAETAIATAERLILADRNAHGPAILSDCPVMILGVRGYYRDTMGRPRTNDFGIYDDAGFLIDTGRGEMVPFNWNCDPIRTGWNPGVNKVFAQLCPGIWPFRQGPHRGVSGHLRQLTTDEANSRHLDTYFLDPRGGGQFQVRRVTTETRFVTEWGYQAINVHEGSARGTSSWGCQTLPPSQWAEFSKKVYAWMDRAGQKWIPYALTEERIG